MKFLEFLKSEGYDKLYRAVLMLICLTVLSLFAYMAVKYHLKLDGATIIIGAIIWLMQQIGQFDFGSSSGSKKKDKLLSDASSNQPGAINTGTVINQAAPAEETK